MSTAPDLLLAICRPPVRTRINKTSPIEFWQCSLIGKSTQQDRTLHKHGNLTITVIIFCCVNFLSIVRNFNESVPIYTVTLSSICLITSHYEHVLSLSVVGQLVCFFFFFFDLCWPPREADSFASDSHLPFHLPASPLPPMHSQLQL